MSIEYYVELLRVKDSIDDVAKLVIQASYDEDLSEEEYTRLQVHINEAKARLEVIS